MIFHKVQNYTCKIEVVSIDEGPYEKLIAENVIAEIFLHKGDGFCEDFNDDDVNTDLSIATYDAYIARSQNASGNRGNTQQCAKCGDSDKS